MQKVTMIIMGKTALVDADMAKKVAKKHQLVADARAVRNSQSLSAADQMQVMSEITTKIIRLNRTIRNGCVQFV
jgi:2,4-dienoyl-CoA reductase-like NADH-dependent reductase (Old Yellow Enzyme family)